MIHQYQLNGFNIVLDVCSGAVHVVDELAYDMIALYETHSMEEVTAAMSEKHRNDPSVTKQEIVGCYDEIKALKEAGQLFTPDRFEPMAGRFKAELQLLFCQPGEIPRRTGCDERRGRKAGAGFSDRTFRQQTESGS